MILFFDRDVGTALPKALQLLQFDRHYHELHYHQQHFPGNCPDDVWLPEVGRRGWTVIGHDSHHHTEESELSAVKQYSIGCFYLWGAEAKRWEKLRCFARAYDRIVQAESSTTRPFIYRVTKAGLLQPVLIP